MSYKNATELLPEELLELVQQYIDGEYIYIPRKSGEQRPWGANTVIREELATRNASIFEEYQRGRGMNQIADDYYLSTKSVQRIILHQKRCCVKR